MQWPVASGQWPVQDLSSRASSTKRESESKDLQLTSRETSNDKLETPFISSSVRPGGSCRTLQISRSSSRTAQQGARPSCRNRLYPAMHSADSTVHSALPEPTLGS